MKELMISNVAKVRISDTIREELEYVADKEYSVVKPAVGRSGIESRFLSIETNIPRGPKIDYGLLGISYKPQLTGELTVTVGYCVQEGRRWEGAIAYEPEKVFVGLPQEFAVATMEGLLSALPSPPSGILRVTEAAEGYVGSSENLFYKLGRATAELLFLEEHEKTDDQLIARLSFILLSVAVVLPQRHHT
jgi:hypothetical protein